MGGRLPALAGLALVATVVVWAVAGNRQPAAGPEETTRAGMAPATSTTDGAADPPSMTETTAATQPATTAPPVLGSAKELTEVDGWLQSDVSSLEELRGKVVLVEFWTFGCSNCRHTLRALQGIYARNAGPDFEMVGVHSPEFDYERDPEAVARAAADLGVTWPIALDTDRHNFHAWQGGRAYWPRVYILDRAGNIRFDHIGEGAYEEMEATVAALIAET
jgi:thiol-disulfide isomerase/thioredoxin